MATGERLICTAADLVNGGRGVRFEVERAGERLPAFAVRFSGKVYAYLNQCAHVPVELDWQPGEFFADSGLYLLCSTHGAMYAPDTGRCLGGRCDGRSLRPLPVSERAGQIFLITSEGLT